MPVIQREIVLGKNAKVWRLISLQPGVREKFAIAIGHADLNSFPFQKTDRVWVFSYSRKQEENSAILDKLTSVGVAEVVYVTSSSTIVADQIKCYEYPRVKLIAEKKAFEIQSAKILTLGLVVKTEDELPAGSSVATKIEDIAAFMLSPKWSESQGKRAHLFKVVDRPFSSRFEAVLYAMYGWLMKIVASQPCLLRPIDFFLRLMGMKWYGYTYLSNRQWITSTTS